MRKFKTGTYASRGIAILITLVILTYLFPAGVNADSSMDQVNVVNPCDEAILWGPYLTGTTHNSTVIHWKTTQPSIGRVNLIRSNTTSSGISSVSVSENNSSYLHAVFLDNLEPGGQYFYDLGNCSQNFSFRTLPLNGSFTFIVYGDTREQLPFWNQSTHHALVAERIAKEPDCLFVVHTGDFVNDPSDEEEWGRFFKAAGPMLANTTFYPVPGNHEGNLSTYQEIFGMQPWYSFESADARFVVLDSNTITKTTASDQDRWLNGTLENKTAWNFVFLHHPLYTSEVNHWGGYENIQKKWGPVFNSGGINAVFSAHVHAYEHFEVNGSHYFTVATGGAPSYTLSSQKSPGYICSRENTLGYMRVTVNPQQVLLEFVPVAELKDRHLVLLSETAVGERVMILKARSPQDTILSQFIKRSTPVFGTRVRMFF